MQLISPALNINEEASCARIKECITHLSGMENSYLILERDDLSYMQILLTSKGYHLEYQDGSIDKHYQYSKHSPGPSLSSPHSIPIGIGYLETATSV